jgi:predicted ArsR family transcriptional regulator
MRSRSAAAAEEEAGQALLVGIADPLRLALVFGLARLEQATASQLGEHCHASTPTVRRYLETLVTMGIVAEAAGTSDGATPGRPPSWFSLKLEVRERVKDLLESYGESFRLDF